MALTPGTRLGPYVIEAAAGAGGMGEVYKAKDTRLDRIVAIKVLPHGVADNPDVKARFDREAKTISSLNHPNICILHDVGHEDGIDYLVMEYIEGQTLAERLEDGPIPNHELFRIGIQIADALDKAHRQGLVHRDLKPGNVMLTREGAKLLDFGLAKLQMEQGGVDEVSQVTRTTPLTGEGTIVGTLQYMSPEQLEGGEADARSDIFALGCVLYEMAAGRPAFTGSGRASLIASIMKDLPQPISQIQPMSPPMLERAVMQCIEKDPEHRWQSAGDLKRSLQWIAEGGSQAGIPKPVTQRRKNREKLLWAATAVFGIVAIALAVMAFIQPAPQPQLVQSDISLPAEAAMDNLAGGSLAISPDGEKVAFVATDSTDGATKLWVRSLNSLVAQPLPNTNNAYFLFWSPDSRYIAYFDNNSLKKILATGGPTLTLANVVSGRGGDWNDDGVIVYAPDQQGPLYRVSASGGNAEQLTVLDTTLEEDCHRWVKFLPNGRNFLYFSRVGANGSEQDAICVGALDSDEIKRLIPCKSTIGYFNEHILFVRDGTLMAQRFDEADLEIVGDPMPIVENIVYFENWARGVFSASDDGSLVYRMGAVSDGSQIRVYDTLGRVVDSIGPLARQFAHSLSPDDRKMAVDIYDQAAGHGDIWIWDLDRGIKSRLTFGDGFDAAPKWSPDGSEVAWISGRAGKRGIMRKSAVIVDSARWVYEAEAGWIFDWTSDGRYIIAGIPNDRGGSDMRAIHVEDTSKSLTIMSAEWEIWGGVVSPDMRWIAYGSDESGREEVYVTTFPNPTGKWQISTSEGDRPRWRADGRALFYLDNKDQIMRVDVDGSGQNFLVGSVEPMFAVNGSRPGSIYDFTGDGKTFYVNERLDRNDDSRVVLIQNWQQLVQDMQ